VLDHDYFTLEASRETHYIDPGATCVDDCDGDLNRRIIVSGNVVDRARVGCYNITYNCKNDKNVSAPEVTRVVCVEDTVCPICHIQAGPSTVEASFPYYDSGAICTDSVDGATAVHVQGVSELNVEATGTYVITYRAEDMAGNWNDGPSVGGTGKCSVQNNTRTIVVVDTLVPVIALQYGQDPATNQDDQTTIHSGYSGDVSKTDIKWRNPARKHNFAFGSLMAETAASAQGGGKWRQVLALGSGALGMAVLGVAVRKALAPTPPSSPLV
jgi:hypothetical protein